jgi:glycosyltransferase involved in cell wall biosynthesis
VSAANAPGAAGNSSRILAMLWHSPYEFVVSGGFRRTQEILKRVPACIEVLAIDSSPTMLEETGSLKVIEYRFPAWIRRLDRRFFFAIRLLEWFCALASMVAVCVRLWMRGERFDAVYVPSSEIIPALAAGIFAKYLFRCRLVPCNTNIEYYPPVVRRLLAWMHNRSDQVITLSMDLERSLRRNGVRAPVALNAVGLDLDVIEECLSGADSSKDYEAVFIGRHDQSKGILDLLEAWGLVTERLPRARLVTIGTMTPMYAPRVRQLIEKHGLEERVLVLDAVDEKTKFRLIKESKVCLFPSYLEGWGIVPQEALACGLPVVVYDLPVYLENIKPCPAVFAVPAGDIDALAGLAVELLSGGRYEEYEEVGPEFVKRFQWPEIAGAEFDIITAATHAGDITCERPGKQ